MWKRLTNRKWLLWTAAGLVGLPLLYWLLPVANPLFNDDYSTVVKAENGSLLHVFTNRQEQWHLPPDTLTVPDKLKTAVIQYEDAGYYRHLGVNLGALFRALGQNIKHGTVVSGASTIPMQVARMARPKKRTYLNKARELFLAIKLSVHYSKADLLKLYLDHAPYGGNVVGYRTASYRYFGKEAYALTWSEAATLAVLPNAPGLIHPARAASSLQQKKNQLLEKLHEKGYLDDQYYELALLEPVPDRVIPFESQVPHLARHLKQANPGRWLLQTTLNAALQSQCNQLATKHKNNLSNYGIHNLAILVAETKTGAIKAYVGSPDFFDHEHAGQVDGVRAPRSSGSTLKPFLYGLSMDEGIITPNSFLRDLPTYFDGFTPNNANREFQGVVTARDALVESLNIPAVRLLNTYGVFQFYSFLKLAGTTTLFRTADDYGLPLVLGGGEVTAWDLVKLYRGLANRGVFRDNHVLADETTKASPQLISAGACYLTLDILKDLKRPGSEYYWQRFNGSRSIAWKTGTSFGHKDAWAVGVTPEYTIAVWVGNFNGEGNKNLSGVTTAGPLFFDILQCLPQKGGNRWFTKRATDFAPLTLCALSGFRATDACPEAIEVDVPVGMKPLKACDYHQFRYFSTDGRYQTCSQCWQSLGAERKSVTLYPPDIAFYLKEKGQYIAPLPSHYPDCPSYSSESTLKLIYPNLEAKLFLPRDYDGQTQTVVCKAGHSGTDKKVFWYLDEHYLGSTIANHVLSVRFKPGWNHLKVIDETGAQDSRLVFAVVK